MFCMSCGARVPDGAQFCYKCGGPMMRPATPTQAAATQAPPPQAAPPSGAPGWTGAPPSYMHPMPLRRRPSPLELVGDVIALLGLVILIVDFWADWWVLLVIGILFLVVGLVLWFVAWTQRQRPQPAMTYAPTYPQPPARR